MKTVVNRSYDQFNQIKVEERKLPPLRSDEVQVRIHAAALNKADLLLAKGKPFMIRLMYGFSKPNNIYPGSDFSGEVLDIGDDVTQFKIGDRVFGDLSGVGFGAFAEMVHVKETSIWHMPKGYSYPEAASLPMPMGTALEAIRKAGNLKDKKILVYGASGGVGRLLVQLARSESATVGAVASKKHQDDLATLGISKIDDYQEPSFALPKHHYDIIFAVNGYQPLKSYGKALVRHGSCVIIGGSGKQLFAAMTKGWYYRIFKKKNISTVLAKTGQEVLKSIASSCVKTKIDVQIGHTYPLIEVSKAYSDFENHAFKGKYVIDMDL